MPYASTMPAHRIRVQHLEHPCLRLKAVHIATSPDCSCKERRKHAVVRTSVNDGGAGQNEIHQDTQKVLLERDLVIANCGTDEFAAQTSSGSNSNRHTHRLKIEQVTCSGAAAVGSTIVYCSWQAQPDDVLVAAAPHAPLQTQAHQKTGMSTPHSSYVVDSNPLHRGPRPTWPSKPGAVAAELLLFFAQIEC